MDDFYFSMLCTSQDGREIEVGNLSDFWVSTKYVHVGRMIKVIHSSSEWCHCSVLFGFNKE